MAELADRHRQIARPGWPRVIDARRRVQPPGPHAVVIRPGGTFAGPPPRKGCAPLAGRRHARREPGRPDAVRTLLPRPRSRDGGNPQPVVLTELEGRLHAG